MSLSYKQRLDAAMAAAKKAADDWFEKKREEGGIERAIKDRLESRLTEIVGQLLGFDVKWGGWEVDHCNGRAGESAAGDWLRDRAGTAVKKWLDEQAGGLPALPVKAQRDLRKQYLDRYYRSLSEVLCDMAHARAVADADEMIEKVLRKTD